MNEERISINEERLNKILSNIKALEKEIEVFKLNTKDLTLLNKYYGSKNWFKDKEDFESGKIKNINAGVLSEDAVWNMNEDINYIIKEMKSILKQYENKNKNKN